MSQSLRSKIRSKKKLYQKYKRSGSIAIYDKFIQVKHSVQKELRISYQTYINNLISFECDDDSWQNTHLKKFWSFIKGLRKENTSITSLNYNGNVLVDPIAKANALNSHFKSIFTTEDYSCLPNKGPSPHPTIADLSISTFGIHNLLSSLNIHKSAGPDEINAIVLKETREVTAPILCAIFRCSLQNGTVPGDWKKANVVPIYKKGNRQHPSNYRPISLTSIVSKLFEKIISSHIVKHLESHNMLYDLQHGFRQHRSCETQLVSLIHELMTNFDNNIQSDLILMDFAKAFDTVPYQRLLYKLQWYGVWGNIYRWIQSFLCERTQKVVQDGVSSSPVMVTSGVPQGSVLGPILFLIYINDLPEYIKYSTIRLFADDCILYRPVKSFNDSILLQEDINSLYSWASTWLMNFNISKCYSMNISQSRTNYIPTQYYLDNRPLTIVDHCKYLGVVIQSNLNWTKHVEEKVAKANTTLSMLRRNLKTNCIQTKDLAYRALVRPQLEYASVAWSPWQQGLSALIEKVQRRSARFVMNDYQYNSSVSNMILNLSWDTLEHRRIKSRLSLFYKILHGLAAVPVEQYIQPCAFLQTRGSHQYKFHPIFSHKNIYKSSFFPATIPLWNILPSEIVNCNSLYHFKLFLDNYHLL